MEHTHDAILIGHGIAGAVLAEELIARGLRVAVFDRRRAGSASHVAAGVVNPVVLRRIIPSWRAAGMLDAAAPFYREQELRSGARFWHPLPLVELFANERAAAEWRERSRDPALQAFLRTAPGADLPAGIQAPFGRGEVGSCAWLDVNAFLEARAAVLRAQGALIDGLVGPQDLVEEQDRVCVKGICAPVLVHCEGPFAELPGLVPVKGETLILRIPGLGLHAMVHRGVFVLPLGDDLYRVGATFKWDAVWAGPTEAAERWLLERLGRVLAPVAMERVERVAHLAGVRPTARDRRPLLGRITARQAVFNGLGARGVLLAPWCAKHLADHLLDGAPLDPEVDRARFA